MPNDELRMTNVKKKRSIRHSTFDIRNSGRYLVGGVNSPVRAFKQVDGDPLAVVRGRGGLLTDADGRSYIDFIMGWGALILGHQHPAVLKALRGALNKSTILGLTHPDEIELAKLIVEAVPSVEQVRFTPSGTEACMTAVRLARAVTGHAKIIAFEGCYHGHGDALMAGKTAGIPDIVASDIVRVAYNDDGALARALQQHGRDVACAIIEPIAANMGVVPPAAGFLQRVRQLTQRHGALLILDEVVTGFRVGYGGAQGLFGVQPDLTTFGKIIGGGMPIGAVGGPRRVMQRLAPQGDVYHAGTFAGHPLSMAAGIATLTHLAQASPYKRLNQLAQRLAGGIKERAQKAGVAVQVNRVGSMLTVFFSDGQVANATQAAASRRDRFAQWAVSLRRQGVLVPPSALEALFISTAHTDAQIDRAIQAAGRAFQEIRSPRSAS